MRYASLERRWLPDAIIEFRTMTVLKQGWRRDAGELLCSPFALRAIIIVVTPYLLVNFPALSFFALWGTLIWIVPRAIQDRRRLREEESQPDPMTEAIAEFLQLELEKAQCRIGQLENDLETWKQKARTSSPPRDDRGHPVYRRVGLDQDCPNDLHVIPVTERPA
jgi:hypothetical protein